MIKAYERIIDKAKSDFKANRKFLEGLRTKRPKKLDEIIHRIHKEVFEDVDCLDCANCCITTGVHVKDADVVRIAKHLSMKNKVFIDKYITEDEDEDFVFTEVPCQFLREDNYCSIYEVRPKACREYPHTDQRRFYNRLILTEKNSIICPAVAIMLDKLRDEIG